MRALVLGCRGQLGRALEPVLSEKYEVVGVDRDEVDITEAGAVSALVREVAPAVVVNCAAYTAVDQAEHDPEAAFAVNAGAVATLAGLVDEIGAKLVQISTDYVFDGRLGRSYREDDLVNPVSVYGRSKRDGEEAARSARRHLIVRTAWLYGQGGANFVQAILRQVDRGAVELRVVDDQWGSPTWSVDLAAAVGDLLAVDAEGVVHAVNQGVSTWFGFAEEMCRLLGIAVSLVPISTGESGRPAPRPPRAILDTSRLQALLGHGLPPWEEALGRYLRTVRWTGQGEG